MKKGFILAFVMAAVFTFCSTAYAEEIQDISIEDLENGKYEYYGNVEVSAYYPGEDGYTVNHTGELLEDLAGKIVACPTGSTLLGKTVAIKVGENVILRKVWDTGCKSGRIDLLVMDRSAMNFWGLRYCDVWIVEDENNGEN